jgi:hypothetical protein
MNVKVIAAVAVAEAIRDLGEVPSGHLYVALMSKMSLNEYNRIISALKGAGLVEEKSYLLKWVGPKLEAENAQE